MQEWIYRRLKESRLPDDMGPDASLWCFCPARVQFFWRAREMKGSVTIWELMDMPHRPGMGRVITGMGNALAAAENAAQARFNKDNGGKEGHANGRPRAKKARALACRSEPCTSHPSLLRTPGESLL
ncbi:hypothetical protein EON79_19960 [bacterium]|nr:MAG: hypothetical protein EON79_19960 [bacterium]